MILICWMFRFMRRCIIQRFLLGPVTVYFCTLILHVLGHAPELEIPTFTTSGTQPNPQGYQHSRVIMLRSQSTGSTLNESTACLMCHSCPKNGRYDFCSIMCRDEARNISPLLLEVPHDHTTFMMGAPLEAIFSGDIMTVYT
jgi:hypothetical protein